MKNYVAATAIALVTGIAAPVFALNSSTPLETGVVNSIQRIDSTIEVPSLDDKDLAYLKSVLDDGNSQDWEKGIAIQNYFDRS